jgi:hemerythrin
MNMTPVEWTADDLVFSRQLDADHRKLFEDLETVRQAAEVTGQASQVSYHLWRLSKDVAIHFKSEERLMQQCRYPAKEWHAKQHQAGRNKMNRLLKATRAGGSEASAAALEEFARWMKDHVRLADRMFAAHLRNDRLGRLAS